MAKNDNLVTNNLMKKLIATSQTKRAVMMSKSTFMNAKDMITTDVPALNIALSGSIDGGLTPGLTTIAGPSRHFKSLLMLIMAKSYLDKYPDGVCVLYDSEFGTPLSYLKSLNIDPDRVIHSPVVNVEELRNDIANLLDKVEKGDKICILIDSVGNLASKKEAEDAISGNTAADMTRAKQLKSLFRIVTPHLTLKDIPMIVVNHTYKEIGLFPKDIVSGGTGSIYSSDTIWIMGRQQEKDGSELAGYNFIINVEKSRFVKEKSKIPVKVLHNKGVDYYSGLLDLALEGGFVVKPNVGWYSLPGEEKRYREKEAGKILDVVLKDTAFNEFVKSKYKLAAASELISKGGHHDEPVEGDVTDEDFE